MRDQLGLGFEAHAGVQLVGDLVGKIDPDGENVLRPRLAPNTEDEINSLCQPGQPRSGPVLIFHRGSDMDQCKTFENPSLI